MLLQNSDRGIWEWGNWEGSETCVVVIQGLYILEHSTPILRAEEDSMVQLLTSEGLISDITALLPLGAKQSKVFECDSCPVPTA